MSRGHLRGLIAAGDKAAFAAALAAPERAVFAKESDLLLDIVARGWDDMIAPLAAAGADVEACDRQGRTPLHIAAATGRTAAIDALRAAGAVLDSRDARDETPLHAAIDAGQTEAVHLLLRRGADPCLTAPARPDGMNAWHRAAQSGSPDVMAELLKHPQAARMEDFCRHGRTRADTFRLALQAGHMPVVRLLLDYGVAVNRHDDEGHTPLHWLLQHRHTRAEALPMVRLLLRHGADGDRAANSRGETPLMVAADADFPEAVRLLIEQDADVTRRDHLRQTALHAAARHYTVETIRLLLDAGAEIDAADRTGRTPLHIAAQRNRRDVVKTLLARGANPLLKDSRGRTPDRLCLAPVQETTRHLVLRAQAAWHRAGGPAGAENGRLRRRFNPYARQRPVRRPRPFGKKPPSNGGGYRP